MLELEQARQRIFDSLSTLPSELALVSKAAGRIVAEPVIAPVDLPLFDNSAMDGFGVQAADLVAASREKPVTLHLLGEIPAGHSFSFQLKAGTCVRVFTGSPLPASADAVIMQEDVAIDEKQPDKIVCFEPIKPWENVRLRGEDLKKWATMLAKGDRVGAGAIGLLGAVGLKEITVIRQPLVGVLATGSELLEAGDSPQP